MGAQKNFRPRNRLFTVVVNLREPVDRLEVTT